MYLKRGFKELSLVHIFYFHLFIYFLLSFQYLQKCSQGHSNKHDGVQIPIKCLPDFWLQSSSILDTAVSGPSIIWGQGTTDSSLFWRVIIFMVAPTIPKYDPRMSFNYGPSIFKCRIEGPVFCCLWYILTWLNQH